MIDGFVASVTAEIFLYFLPLGHLILIIIILVTICAVYEEQEFCSADLQIKYSYLCK